MMEPTHPEDVYDKDSFIEVLEIAAGQKFKIMKLVKYRVYDKRGFYHQSYLGERDAINCANHINGVVKLICDDGEKPLK